MSKTLQGKIHTKISKGRFWTLEADDGRVYKLWKAATRPAAGGKSVRSRQGRRRGSHGHSALAHLC